MPWFAGGEIVVSAGVDVMMRKGCWVVVGYVLWIPREMRQEDVRNGGGGVGMRAAGAERRQRETVETRRGALCMGKGAFGVTMRNLGVLKVSRIARTSVAVTSTAES